MSNQIDKQSIVNKLSVNLAYLQPQNVYVKFHDEINAIQLKIISSMFGSFEHFERIKIVSDAIVEIANTDLKGFDISIVALTNREDKQDTNNL